MDARLGIISGATFAGVLAAAVFAATLSGNGGNDATAPVAVAAPTTDVVFAPALAAAPQQTAPAAAGVAPSSRVGDADRHDGAGERDEEDD